LTTLLSRSTLGLCFVTLAVTIFHYNHTFQLSDLSYLDASPIHGEGHHPATTNNNQKIPDYRVDETCKALPTIRPSGSYFLDSKIKAGNSSEGVSPSFHVGSYMAEKIKYHMQGDRDNFQLIKERLWNKAGGIALDIGANQGFYTYYLASLGMDVHSFEINAQNFKALQHGAEFNPKEVSDRVHLYPVGMGDRNARFGMNGSGYGGFLKGGDTNDSGGGPILGVTMDCFFHHTSPTLDWSNHGVAFVKIDVEGFEIAVLKGAKNSLFRQGGGDRKVGALIMEVGPDRWGRSGIDLEEGVREMMDLATHFRNSYIILRGDKNCPWSLAEETLADKNPRTLDTNKQQMYKVATNEEWKNLLQKMETNGSDCNFFYQN